MCHPFTNDANDIAMMHNGEIANFKEHWAHLKQNHKFKSYNPAIDWITDSEVAVHLIDEEVKKGAGFDEALRTIMPRLTGQVLLCLISEKDPDTIWLANRWQPCFIGLADNEAMWASSKVGLDPVKDELKKIYQPPKNSLIKLMRGEADVQILDPNYKVADLKLNKRILKEKWKALRRDYGVDIVNPLIEVLDELIDEQKIGKRIDYRAEGYCLKTPRFMYNVI
jgi:glucosamine 6-phosphate synthetase-like amidotransferase/phosphosugar isomerase protein